MLKPEERRKKELLLESRRKRREWIYSAEYVLDVEKVIQEKNRGQQKGVERTTITKLFDNFPELDEVLPTAKEYVGFLNDFLEEEDRDIIECKSLLLDGTTTAKYDGDDDGLVQEFVPIPKYGDIFSYDVFLAKLAHPSSAEIVKSMQRFINAFILKQNSAARSLTRDGGNKNEVQKSRNNAPAESVHAFIESLQLDMKKCPAWKDSVSKAFQWEETREYLEKFILIKLHRYLFNEVEQRQLGERDMQIHERLQDLAFLGPQHLDVQTLNTSARAGPPSLGKIFHKAIGDFSAFVEQKCPADMMSQLLSCAHHVTQALIDLHQQQEGSERRLPGADEFLPVVILVIKESNPPKLHTALETVQRYRHPSKLLSSEAAYYFTNIVSAVHFLETAEADQLSMAPEDFERSVESCRRLRIESGGCSSVGRAPPPEIDANPSSSLKRAVHRRSIQDVRQERHAQRVSTTYSLPPPPPSPLSTIQSLAQQVHTHLVPPRASGGSESVPPSSAPLLRSLPQSIPRACGRFLHPAQTAQDLKLSDVQLLLQEYRALVSLAVDLSVMCTTHRFNDK